MTSCAYWSPVGIKLQRLRSLPVAQSCFYFQWWCSRYQLEWVDREYVLCWVVRFQWLASMAMPALTVRSSMILCKHWIRSTERLICFLWEGLIAVVLLHTAQSGFSSLTPCHLRQKLVCSYICFLVVSWGFFKGFNRCCGSTFFQWCNHCRNCFSSISVRNGIHSRPFT